jgi:alpha-galactosidase
MGSYTPADGGETVTWQIETSGSWNWELSNAGRELYLLLSGPSLQENGFTRLLQPGERFASVPCAVAFAADFESSIQALTQYRRRIRRENDDNAHPTVIFNDYMNCLFGHPTDEKEYPLIDAAAQMGCKYYCIDCGWYADGSWWTDVGEWLPSQKRFPDGIEVVLRYIREKGMIPGLWLEIEVMGIHCPMAQRVPKEWFFQRSGRPVIDHGRYQLDFRNPEVRAYADSVIARLANDYGVGYIKMDYNINAGMGTEYQADSVGSGLFEHTRAYQQWLDEVFIRYPALVIENCGSGGLRMDYAQLSRYSIQSVTDQVNYLKMAYIACNCPTAVTPEQAAIWSYPLKDGDLEETAFNMVNALLLRVHQSGHLANLAPERLALVRDGIDCHLTLCEAVKEGVPFWPLGLASTSDDYFCLGMDCGDSLYLAVWNVSEQAQEITVPLQNYLRAGTNVTCLYPQSLSTQYAWDAQAQALSVNLQPRTARVFAAASLSA